MSAQTDMHIQKMQAVIAHSLHNHTMNQCDRCRHQVASWAVARECHQLHQWLL